MVDEISDAAAKAFAIKFYAAVASGQSLASALTQGQAAIDSSSSHSPSSHRCRDRSSAAAGSGWAASQRRRNWW
jgi:hypothetical protein